MSLRSLELQIWSYDGKFALKLWWITGELSENTPFWHDSFSTGRVYLQVAISVVLFPPPPRPPPHPRDILHYSERIFFCIDVKTILRVS